MAIVRLSNARLSFPALFDAEDYEGDGKFAYKASFLIEEDQAVHVQQADKSWKKTTMKDVILSVATEQWKTKAVASLKTIEGQAQKFCWLDGATKSYDGYEGMFVLTARRPVDKGRPRIVGHDNSPLTQSDGKPYAGCYVNGTVELWAQDNNFGKGMRATLRGVQFLRDGDAFSAGAPVSDDEFEEIDAPQTEDELG
jgi:hypothetical protein